MKKYIPAILSGICCILLGVTMVQNYELKRQISEMESNLWNRVSQMENAVNGITYNIETTLEEEAALLIDDAWSFQDEDIEEGTVTAVLEVMPKEYHPEKTKAVIVCNETEYPMSLKNGVFRAEVEVSLFEESLVERVLFEDDGAIRAENLNWSLTPRHDLLPMVYAHYAGGATGRRGQVSEGMYEITLDGELAVDVDQKVDAEPIRSIYMVEMVDDEIIGRTEIPLKSGESGEASQDGVAAEAVRRSSASYLLPESFTYELDQKKVSFPYGSTYAMYVEVEDGYGLLHRAWAWREKISETGEPVDDDHGWWRGAEASIFNADGEALAAHDEEFY